MKISSSNEVVDAIGRFGIVPVVTIENVEIAQQLADALREGGLPLMEVTFRTSAASKVLETLSKSGSDILLGAGTVLTTDQTKSALDAGARFIVSPGLNRKIVEFCLSRSIAVFPGVVTPTEISAAMEMGLYLLKFFPAEVMGGVKYLKAVSAPFRTVRFIPTGGIDSSNILSYFQIPAVWAVGGSWMIRKELIDQKKFQEISKCTADALKLISGVKRKSQSERA